MQSAHEKSAINFKASTLLTHEISLRNKALKNSSQKKNLRQKPIPHYFIPFSQKLFSYLLHKFKILHSLLFIHPHTCAICVYIFVWCSNTITLWIKRSRSLWHFHSAVNSLMRDERKEKKKPWWAAKKGH